MQKSDQIQLKTWIKMPELQRAELETKRPRPTLLERGAWSPGRNDGHTGGIPLTSGHGGLFLGLMNEWGPLGRAGASG